MRLFVDANVLFSAAITPSERSNTLFELVGDGPHLLVMSAHAIEEATRNVFLRYPEASDRLAALVGSVRVVPEGNGEDFTAAEKHDLPTGDTAVLAAP